ncbi:MAG TPA: hypothetical protein VF187_00340 [Gemmatimonadales bacterium]
MKPTLAAGALLIAGIAGCATKDARLEKLSVGITRDSAFAIMGPDAPVRVGRYLTGGKYLEVMYFRQRGVEDSLDERLMSPLILLDGTLAAWGWQALDSVAVEKKIQVAPKK